MAMICSRLARESRRIAQLFPSTSRRVLVPMQPEERIRTRLNTTSSLFEPFLTLFQGVLIVSPFLIKFELQHLSAADLPSPRSVFSRRESPPRDAPSPSLSVGLRFHKWSFLPAEPSVSLFFAMNSPSYSDFSDDEPSNLTSSHLYSRSLNKLLATINRDTLIHPNGPYYEELR